MCANSISNCVKIQNKNEKRTEWENDVVGVATAMVCYGGEW